VIERRAIRKLWLERLGQLVLGVSRLRMFGRRKGVGER